MTRLIYTHRKGELGKLKRREAAKPAAREASRLDQAARKTQAAARQTAGESAKLRKSPAPGGQT